MDDSKIIEQLFIIVTELDARDCSNNSIASCFHGISWEALCNMGVDYVIEYVKSNICRLQLDIGMLNRTLNVEMKECLYYLNKVCEE